MKVSELWLRDLIKLPYSIRQIGDDLTQAGIEVEQIEVQETNIKQDILTLKIPPNRGDCLSMEGIARELAAIHQIPYEPLPVPQVVDYTEEMLPVRIEEKESCPRYVGCIVKNIQQVVTPRWLQERLEMAGIKPISAIVDIMNYVMLEIGQPLHAFNLTSLQKEIVVRKAKPQERLVLLNNQEIELTPESLVIADSNKTQALAGIMGGLDSSVNEKTTAIWIESAYFNPIAIRLTAKRYGLRTEASYRFERGVDPLLPRRALERALQLIREIAGGEVGTFVDQTSEKHLPQKPKIFLRKKRVYQILGSQIDDTMLFNILQNLKMEVSITEDGFIVFPPTYRSDVTSEIDLIEEIARIYGFHRLQTSIPLTTLKYFPLSEKRIRLDTIKELLINRGYHEIISYSFIDPKASSLCSPERSPLRLLNPIAADMAVMRVSLWPGLLQAIQHNQHRQWLRARFFEIGSCFIEENGKWFEQSMLSGVVTGSLYPEQWGTPSRLQDFYDVKNDIEALCRLGGQEEAFSFEKAEHPTLHPGKTARLLKQGKEVGYIGVLHPNLVKAYELEGVLIGFELKINELQEQQIPAIHSLSKFPMIRRDLAILVDSTILAAEIKSAVLDCAGMLLKQLILFDVYQGNGIEANKKSIALGLILQHPSRTLIEDEVNALVQKVVTMLFNRFQAVLRIR